MPFDWIYVVGLLLILALAVWGFRQRPRGGEPTSTPARNEFERLWDTPEHSETYGEDPHAPARDRQREQHQAPRR